MVMLCIAYFITLYQFNRLCSMEAIIFDALEILVEVLRKVAEYLKTTDVWDRGSYPALT
jgi:hypothetical protein